MIDRAERDKLAQLLEGISTGLISEKDFVKSLPEDSNDQAVMEIADQAYWISPELKRESLRQDVDMWVLFLSTDLEYEWPPFPTRVGYFQPLALGTLAALLLGALAVFVLESSLTVLILVVMLSYLAAILWPALHGAIQDASYERAGDNDVWPFIRRSDYEEALGR